MTLGVSKALGELGYGHALSAGNSSVYVCTVAERNDPGICSPSKDLNYQGGNEISRSWRTATMWPLALLIVPIAG